MQTLSRRRRLRRRQQGGQRAGHQGRPRRQHADRRRLRAAFPDDVILSEEIPDDGSRLGRARVWMVDPIDGTRDFILGDDGFAVMIGLCVDGRPTVGAVAQPVTGKTYTGIAGEGAWLDHRDTPTAPRAAAAHVDARAPARHPPGGVEVAPHAARRRRPQGAGDRPTR